MSRPKPPRVDPMGTMDILAVLGDDDRSWGPEWSDAEALEQEQR